MQKTILQLKRIVFIIVVSLFGANLFAQDIEPRRWTPMPLGIHALGIGYANTNGDIFFDPLLQAEDVTVKVNSFVMQYVQPFKLGNRLARLDVTLPYSFARWDGLLAGVPTTVKRNGFSDPRLRLSLNLIGPKAIGLKEMMEYMKSHPTNTIVGVSIAVTLPLGQYFDEKILNLGSNRFVFRPQIGMVHNWGKWSYELTGSVFLYANNNNFANGKTKKQDPIFALQTHLIRRFNPKIWASLSFGYGLGGQSIVNNQPNNDARGNLLLSPAFGYSLTKRQAIKIAYLRLETLKDIGADTNTFVIAWSTVF
jgi:hypothetical protein